MSVDAREEMLAELLAAVLSPRAERVTNAMLETVPAEVRGELRAMQEALAAVAIHGVDPVAPSAGLRARLLRTVASNAATRRAPKRALVVVDMLNDHLTPGRPFEVPRARRVVSAIAKRIDDARASGVPVVYVCDHHAPDDADLEIWPSHNVDGTDGADVWPELAPQAGDRVVYKPAMSGFVRSDLDAVLVELNVDTLVLTGCATEVQLFTTATDALQRGYAVEIPADAQAGSSAAVEQTALSVLSALAPYEPARRELLARVAA
jgi:nicotinamidase-related amidase